MCVFSYLEVQDLGRCATVSKQFQNIAYEKSIWKKLPINLYGKQVPNEFIQRIFERGTSYLNLHRAEISGGPLNFAKPNSLKYLCLNIHNDVMKNILASCTQLEKLGGLPGLPGGVFYDSNDMTNEMSQCIWQNRESLKCLQMDHPEPQDPLGMRNARLVDAINECNQLEELSLFMSPSQQLLVYNLCKNLPQNLKKLRLNCIIKLEDFKALVARCNKLEDLSLAIYRIRAVRTPLLNRASPL